MKKENKELLESLIQSRLEEALKNEDENSTAFREAMEAIDRQLEIDKRELEMSKEELKLQYEKEKEESRQEFELLRDSNNREGQMQLEESKQQFELHKDELNRNFEMNKATSMANLEDKRLDKESIIKCMEIVAAVIVTPLVEAKCKKTFARMLCEFEKDYNFTTMAGKSLSGLFKFRR